MRPGPNPLFGPVALLLALLTACSGADEGQADRYKHVLLISLDTTRADALAVYGGSAAKTPRLDKLANSGVRFDQTTSAAPSTLASHTSIMTGLHPRRHGVARNAFTVHDDNIFLAEVLRDSGFHTAGFAGSFALDQLFNFAQGFEHWDQEFDITVDGRHADQHQRTADEVTGAILDYVSNFDGSERLFLFAHYFDVHAPYAPPEPFASEYMHKWPTSDFGHVDHQITLHQEELIGKKRAVYNIGLSRKLAELAHGNPLPGDKNLSALYAGELAFLDAQVGRLLDGLHERGILDDCIVVLTADHGETFWEHGDFWHHGAWVYETNVRVPLIVYLPDGRGEGRVVHEPVSTTDIFPTLLELLNLPLPEPVAGRSLIPGIDGETLPTLEIFSEATQPVHLYEQQSPWENQLKSKSVRFGQWKYIQTPYMKYEELYDLSADPGEQENLMDSLTPQTRSVLMDMRKKLEAWRLVENPRDSNYDATQQEGVMEALKALGYTGDLGSIGEDEDEDEDEGEDEGADDRANEAADDTANEGAN
jgi:arylsulfatase A-like enzyme